MLRTNKYLQFKAVENSFIMSDLPPLISCPLVFEVQAQVGISLIETRGVVCWGLLFGGDPQAAPPPKKTQTLTPGLIPILLGTHTHTKNLSCLQPSYC